MSAPVLQLSNVESAYGPVRALRGVSLSVPGGQIVALLGPNGAGKSTVLKTISGIIDPRKGTIFFKGDNITALDPSNIVRRVWCKYPKGGKYFRCCRYAIT